MAQIARVGNLVFVSHNRAAEIKRVRVHLHIGNRRLNRRHVARQAIATCGAFLMVRVSFERSS